MPAPFGPDLQALDDAIQQGFLERAFTDPLENNLAYREIADQEAFPARIGSTLTKTRVGLMIPNITPLDPATNTNIDNGLTPQQYGLEQYTLSVAQYPQVAPDINIQDDLVYIKSIAMANADRLGTAQATCLDRLSRNALFNSYMGGNSVITATATSATQAVDDTRGFQTVVVGIPGTTGGQVMPVSSSNPLPVYVNTVLKQVIGFANDSVNVSSAVLTGGTSGTLLFSASFAATSGQSVISKFAPLIVRPTGRTTTAALQSSDLLTMKTIRAGVRTLVNNCIPMVRGAYNFFLNQTSMDELAEDSEFQLLNRGVSTKDEFYENSWIFGNFLKLRFILTSETFIQDPQSAAPVPVAQTVQRPIICGAGSLIEGIFTPGLDAIKNLNAEMGIGRTTSMGVSALSTKYNMKGFYYHVRPPIDRLGQIISQTSNYVGGFTVPTDVTTTKDIIPTASNAYFKRSVIIETA